jgi:hypothetical protein
MNPEQSLVLDFHHTFGATIRRYPSVPSPEDAMLRIRLLNEELGELEQAISAADIVKIADALIDLDYVCFGSAVTCGVILREERYIKLEGRAPALDGDLEYRAHEIKEAIHLLGVTFAHRDTNGIKCALEMIHHQVLLACAECYLPYHALFAEVHRSNMSKLWTWAEIQSVPSGCRAIAVRDMKLEDTGRGFVVKRDDGKVIKSPSYEPADLNKILSGAASCEAGNVGTTR